MIMEFTKVSLRIDIIKRYNISVDGDGFAYISNGVFVDPYSKKAIKGLSWGEVMSKEDIPSEEGGMTQILRELPKAQEPDNKPPKIGNVFSEIEVGKWIAERALAQSEISPEAQAALEKRKYESFLKKGVEDL